MNSAFVVSFALCVILTKGHSIDGIPQTHWKASLVKDALPFTDYDEEAGAVGMDVSILKLVADQYRDRVVDFLAKGSFAEGLGATLLGPIHIAGGVYPTPKMRELVAFTDPYFKDAFVLVVKATNDTISTPADLAGKVVGILEDTDLKSVTSGFDTIKRAKAYRDMSELINGIMIGKAAAGVASKHAVMYGLRAGTINDVKIVGTDVAPRPLSFAVQKEKPDLVERINEHLKWMHVNGTIKGFFREYFGPDVEYPMME